MPLTVVPSEARNSLGAYDASTPTTILPADLILAGTMAASAAALVSLGTADEAVASPLESELLPHALSPSVSAKIPHRARGAVA